MEGQPFHQYDPGLPKKRTRRPHQKSRTGCANCKTRRIKCNETRPTCDNCERFGVSCDYSSTASRLQRLNANDFQFLNSQGNPQFQSKRGRPRANLQHDPFSSQALTLRSLPPPTSNLKPGELALLNHFILRENDVRRYDRNFPSNAPLRTTAPRLGLSHPFVLHLIFEFTALDLARLVPEQKDRYNSLAKYHLSNGIRGMTDLLPTLDRTNCKAIFVAATYACINHLARGPEADDYLLFHLSGEPTWANLLRGVRSIIEAAGPELFTFYSTMSGDSAGRIPKIARPTVETFGCPGIEWISHFDDLEGFVISSGGPDLELNLLTFQRLRFCYDAAFGEEGKEYEGEMSYQNMFTWTYRLDDVFMNCLRDRKPIALILVAHWCVLLKAFEFIWFLHGWPDHILEGVKKTLEEPYQTWVQWPIRQAESLHVHWDTSNLLTEATASH